MLDFVDETLNQMTFFIEVLIIITLLSTAGARWDDRFSFRLNNGLKEIVRIIRFVGNDSVKVIVSYQGRPLSHVMALTTGQNEAKWIAQCIYAHMNFGAETTATAAQCLGWPSTGSRRSTAGG